MKKLCFVFLIFMQVSMIFCQDVELASLGIGQYEGRFPEGLNEGDKAPDFTGYDQTGKQVTLNYFLKDGPVVLFFYRGNWCPSCNEQLKAYQDSIEMIKAIGASLIAITPESIEKVEQTVKLHNLNYTVIYDCMEKIMSDYDVMYTVTDDFRGKIIKNAGIDIAEHNGREAAHLPVTATYIINKEGVITASYFRYNFYDRAPVAWILNNLGTAL